ncbi:hypothetical protein V5799_004529 [Amblyomma americanum]|uniref:Uncharacterized protein n=1 Tax=Amblyomma americanum TaxID=6943 RepID=A0AAQ4D5U8_AMBAM
MSIVMVGPFPGPFNRTHYSDSSSEGAPQPPYAEEEYAAAEQCSQYMPPDDVTYGLPQPDPAVPVQPQCPFLATVPVSSYSARCYSNVRY